jgi:hypothetical protein
VGRPDQRNGKARGEQLTNSQQNGRENGMKI